MQTRAEGAKELRVEGLVARLRREYAEMPGLRLTAAQVARLIGCDSPASRDVVEALLTERLISRTSDGDYVRAEPSP